MAEHLIDTSAWINLFTRRSPGQAEVISDLLRHGQVTITGLIISEILQGIPKEDERTAVRKRLLSLPYMEMEQEDYLQAGELSTLMRRKGATTSLIDILIAQMCVRLELSLLHYDTDFNRIAKFFPLKIHPASLR